MKVYILYISKIYINITGFLGLKKLEKWYNLQMSIFRITIIVPTMATTIMMSFKSLEEVGLKRYQRKRDAIENDTSIMFGVTLTYRALSEVP